MTETEIIKLVFGLFLGVGGGVLLLLAFTVGYRYLAVSYTHLTLPTIA